MILPYIPPEGIYFRLLGLDSRCCIYSRNHKQPEVFHRPLSFGDFEDEYFTLVHGTGKHSGLYAIKSRATGKVLYSCGGAKSMVGHAPEDYNHRGRWFELEPGRAEYRGNFRLKTPSENRVIFSRITPDPVFHNESMANHSREHYFSFIFEELQFEDIEFDVANGKITYSKKRSIASQTLVNDSSQTQQFHIVVGEKRDQRSLLASGNGYPIEKSVKFRANIPVIDDYGEIVIDSTEVHELTYGVTDTREKWHRDTHLVTVEPHEVVKVVFSVSQGEFTVPYTINFSSKTTAGPSAALYRGGRDSAAYSSTGSAQQGCSHPQAAAPWKGPYYTPPPENVPLPFPPSTPVSTGAKAQTYTKGVWRGNATWRLRSEVTNVTEVWRRFAL
ncbi:hypothetical protein BC834DRAFT_827940 [Gloeopeniophorella convolvens]|nr:hypothetical protein BC834DRAFT_827940 [Gloeopeniophorella convolvens]